MLSRGPEAFSVGCEQKVRVVSAKTAICRLLNQLYLAAVDENNMALWWWPERRPILAPRQIVYAVVAMLALTVRLDNHPCQLR